jgi:hypothetical protein
VQNFKTSKSIVFCLFCNPAYKISPFINLYVGSTSLSTSYFSLDFFENFKYSFFYFILKKELHVARLTKSTLTVTVLLYLWPVIGLHWTAGNSCFLHRMIDELSFDIVSILFWALVRSGSVWLVVTGQTGVASESASLLSVYGTKYQIEPRLLCYFLWSCLFLMV